MRKLPILWIFKILKKFRRATARFFYVQLLALDKTLSALKSLTPQIFLFLSLIYEENSQATLKQHSAAFTHQVKHLGEACDLSSF